MEEQIILIYCVCADLLNHLHHVEDKRRRMTDAEMMTTAIVAALHFGGNYEKARLFLKSHHCVPQMLGSSHFNRRLHQLDETCLILFHELAHIWHRLNKEAIYSIDSFFFVSVTTAVSVDHGSTKGKRIVVRSPVKIGTSTACESILWSQKKGIR